jgi:hypothetical protein
VQYLNISSQYEIFRLDVQDCALNYRLQDPPPIGAGVCHAGRRADINVQILKYKADLLAKAAAAKTALRGAVPAEAGAVIEVRKVSNRVRV